MSQIISGTTYVYVLHLIFVSPLTDVGGFVTFAGSLLGTTEISHQLTIEGGVIGSRDMPNIPTNGLTGIPAAVSETPLPAALPLFATGLGVMGWLGWRRKRKNAAALAA